jgi:gamma-glutamyltranspeptidase
VFFRRLLLGQDLEEAVRAPHVHATAKRYYAEPGALTEWEEGVTRYDAIVPFFGGVNAVERSEDGALRHLADPRRGGGVADIRG